MRWFCKPMAKFGPTWPILFLEPFYGGSHKQLVDLLVREFGGDLYSLPASKWHWRSRVAALSYTHTLPAHHNYKVLFCSSVLNLCELVALRPDLANLHKIIYFHENQLVYPVRKQQDRDFQYGYNQILSCLVADSVVFNSHFNMNSFLDGIDSHLRLMPDFRPKGLADQIKTKCQVLYFPLELASDSVSHNPPTTTDCGELASDSVSHNPPPTTDCGELASDSVSHNPPPTTDCGELASDSVSHNPPTTTDCGELASDSVSHNPPTTTTSTDCGIADKVKDEISDCDARNNVFIDDNISPQDSQPLHIVWPHRWEHDKGPDEFCAVLLKLLDADKSFRVSFLGSHTSDIPECIRNVQSLLESRVVHYGPLPREQYWLALQQADIVVSTAKHEFFGVAMMEAVACGCYPLCPNRLVYPELYPSECLYNTDTQLYKRLSQYCDMPWIIRQIQVKVNTSQFTWNKLKQTYHKLLCCNSMLDQ